MSHGLLADCVDTTLASLLYRVAQNSIPHRASLGTFGPSIVVSPLTKILATRLITGPFTGPVAA